MKKKKKKHHYQFELYYIVNFLFASLQLFFHLSVREELWIYPNSSPLKIRVRFLCSYVLIFVVLFFPPFFSLFCGFLHEQHISCPTSCETFTLYRYLLSLIYSLLMEHSDWCYSAIVCIRKSD